MRMKLYLRSFTNSAKKTGVEVEEVGALLTALSRLLIIFSLRMQTEAVRKKGELMWLTVELEPDKKDNEFTSKRLDC